MRRYIRLYLYFLQFSFSKAMEFRLDFTFRIIMDIFYYAANIGLYEVLYRHTNLIGGWNSEQMLVFIAGYLLIDAINMAVFSTNMWWLPYYINKGDLDYYLIRPVAPLFFLSVREFSANSFMNVIIALGIFVYALVNYSGTFSLFQFIAYFILLINGVLIYYCIHMMTILPVFWTQSTRGFIDLFYTIGLAMERPDRIFKGWIRILFTFILPFAVVSSFPARVLLEGWDWNILFHTTIVTIGVWTVMLTIWKIGLRSYSSASS